VSETGSRCARERFGRLPPAEANAIINRARIFDDKGDHAGAIKEYDRILALDSAERILNDAGRFGAHNNRGSSLRSLGDYRAAIADFDKAIEIDPNFAFSDVQRARRAVVDLDFVDARQDVASDLWRKGIAIRAATSRWPRRFAANFVSRSAGGPLRRGSITGVATAIGGMLHTFPFVIWPT
jgi:tetratricopeptide (TPR) repeat protein